MKINKNYINSVTKETIKIILLTVGVFFLIGLPIAYIFIDILKINREMSGIITGIIVALIILIVDHKKVHSMDKIIDINKSRYK